MLRVWIRQSKEKGVLSHLQHLRVGIAFLQETHLPNRDQSKIHKDWVGQMFHSQFNCKSRGVAIRIHKKIFFIGNHYNSSDYTFMGQIAFLVYWIIYFFYFFIMQKEIMTFSSQGFIYLFYKQYILQITYDI